VDRLSGEKGYCRTPREAVVASYGPHFGEEKPLVGRKGSGPFFFLIAIFFAFSVRITTSAMAERGCRFRREIWPALWFISNSRDVIILIL